MCSLYLGENLISGSKPINLGVRNIGEIVASPLPLTDVGLHLLDGSLILGGGIYQGFVDYIADLYTANPSANYWTTEALWQASVTQYGVCGKFVYDSANNTVRLPKYSNKIYTQELNNTASVVGNGMTLGITNGTVLAGMTYGNYASQYYGLVPNSSAYGSSVGTSANTETVGVHTTFGITTDSSKSGLIADLSDITTSLEGYYYIVVATSTKTDIQVDIDEIATDLNGKADTGLANVTDTAKVMISGMGMPSNKYINLTLGASGTTYTAPADGWFCFYTIKSTAGYTYLGNDTNAFRVECRSTINRAGCGCYIPARKGDVVRCKYDGVNNNPFWRFYYAVGSESEAS